MLKFLNVTARTMRRMSARTIRSGVLLFPMLVAGSAYAQFAVSDSGTATYRYDLSLPPGVGGMTPSLSLSYAAGSGNGPLGFGWSLQGISAITRCPATLATDGYSAGVRYSGADKLCLDGQRLIQTDSSGTPLAANLQVNDAQGLGANQYREYRTERDSYARIRAYGYANGDTTGAFGPAYFKVWYKSGQIAEFGASPNADANTNALITSAGTNTTNVNTTANNTNISVPMVWAIARLSNAFGKTIDYKYEQRTVAWGSSTVKPAQGQAPSPDVGREWMIREIQYSGNKIIFNYLVDASGNDVRTDKSEIEPNNFMLPMKNVSTRLLKSITYYVNSSNTDSLGKGPNAVPVKNILLSYTNGPFTGRSLIQTIQECVGEGATRCLPGPKFSYTQGSSDAYFPNATFSASSLATTVLWSGDGNSTFVMPIDVNGDGKTDLLAVNWTSSGSSNQLYLSQGNGAFKVADKFNLSSVNLASANGCNQAYVVDINGDGLPDILVIGNACPSGKDYAYINNGDGAFQVRDVSGVILKREQQQVITDTNGNPQGLSYGSNYYFLDINGDGKLDIVVTESPGPLYANTSTTRSCAVSNCTSIYYGDGSGGFSPGSYSGQSLFSQTDPLDPAVGDVDGDGIDDLTIFARSGNAGVSSVATWVARSRGDGTFESLATPYVASGLTSIPAGTYLTGFISSAGSCRSGGLIDYNGGGKRGCLSGSDTQGANTLSGLTNFNINGANDILGSKDGTIGVDIFDANGDGRQDVLRWHLDATKNALYLSNGDGTFRQSSTFNLGGATPIQLRNYGFSYVLGDFTGHGAVEILRLSSTPTANATSKNLLLTKSDATPPDLMNSVSSGLGVQTNVYYVPLSDASYDGINRYVADPTNPQEKTPTIYVVARTVSDAGVGASIKRSGGVAPTTTTEYSYAGLKKDTRGRGWLGFREVRRQIVAPNGEALTTVTQRKQDYPYIGMTASASTYRGTISATGSSTPLSSTTNVYCDQTNPTGASTTGPRVARPYVCQNTSSGNDLDGTPLPQQVRTVTQFSDSGEPLQAQTQTTGTVAGVTQVFTKTVTNTLDTTANNTACTDTSGLDCAWVIGRMSRTTVNSQVPSAAAGVTSQGTSAVATTVPAGATPTPVPIGTVMNIILNLLMDD